MTLVVFVLLFQYFAEGELDQIFSFSFAVWSGTFYLFMISTFWARIAHLHTRNEARRVYGVVAAESNPHPDLYGRAVPMGSLGAFVALTPSARSLQADPPRGRS